MLSIELEYLMGRAVATDSTDRLRAEWPPHPQRLFSALVAAHEELDLGMESERALRWLETLPNPAIAADRNAHPRDVRPHFVPVNDELLDTKALSKGDDRLDPISLRGSKARRLRYFPAVVPSPASVIFHWPDVDVPPDMRSVLERLLSEISYLGHSSSPVRVTLSETKPRPDWWPDPGGDREIRVIGPGRLDRLRATHRLRQRNESIGIPVGRIQRYSSQSRKPRSVFDEEVRVLRITAGPQPGVTLGLEATIPVMKQLRRALLDRLGTPDGAPEVLSGHDPQGRPAAGPHLAFMPLAHVGPEHADGSVKGFGFALPRDAGPAARLQLEQALERLTHLTLGALGVLQLQPAHSSELAALNFRSRYVGPSRLWTSATPVVLDRHPKRQLSIDRILARACERIGLPEPKITYAGDQARVKGAPSTARYRAALRYLRDAGREPPTPLRNRAWCHVELRFPEDVRGPVLLGAGRFLGYGLLMPVREQDARWN